MKERGKNARVGVWHTLFHYTARRGEWKRKIKDKHRMEETSILSSFTITVFTFFSVMISFEIQLEKILNFIHQMMGTKTFRPLAAFLWSLQLSEIAARLKQQKRKMTFFHFQFTLFLFVLLFARRCRKINFSFWNVMDENWKSSWCILLPSMSAIFSWKVMGLLSESKPELVWT